MERCDSSNLVTERDSAEAARFSGSRRRPRAAPRRGRERREPQLVYGTIQEYYGRDQQMIPYRE